MTPPSRPRLLVLIVAYHAETTIQQVLGRIPPGLLDAYDVEVLVIDDASSDRTFERGEAVRQANTLPFPLTVLANPVALGYGGNQKVGFRYAIEHAFDVVALVHGNGQYAPERLPDMVAPIAAGDAAAVLGSRMLSAPGARHTGMPLYKFLGNRLLTRMQNRLLRTAWSECHSGYRAYATAALRRIPFHLNTNDYHFDTEVLIQLHLSGQTLTEVPIPVYDGTELSGLAGVRYAWNVTKACVKARAADMSLWFDRRFDCQPSYASNVHYKPRLGFESTHELALARVPPGSRVVDLGCAGGYLGHLLHERGCHVTGVDSLPLADDCVLDSFQLYDLNRSPFPVALEGVNVALMLDAIEHLASPERFLDGFREAAERHPDMTFVVSTGNVGFFVVRLMLLLGQFNYGKRGILDLTHTRLYTFGSFRRLLEQSGFDVVEMRGVPAPFPLALGSQGLARLLLALNRAMIAVSRSLFAFQIFAVARPRPGLAYLLDRARREAGARAARREGSTPA